ncbi:MAG: hypothetical protein RDV41_09985 [Planctomycetota bacterium]|nr:hypothetical protein [Planctomycetota bacterium]
MREFKGDWRDMFNSFAVALDLRKMFLGLVGLVFTLVAVGIPTVWLGTVAERECAVRDLDEQLAKKALELNRPVADIRKKPVPPLDLAYTKFVTEAQWLNLDCQQYHDYLLKDRRLNKRDFVWLFGHAVYHINRLGHGWFMLYLLGVTIMLSLIWSVFGGAITRIAAIEVACDERIETQKALHFARQKFGAFFWSFIACVIGFVFFLLCVSVVSLVGRIPAAGPWLNIVLMIFLPLALLSGFLMVLIAIGSIFGLPLFYPSISAEGTDSFDAISRGYSYVFSKPWHYIWYQLVGKFYGMISIGFVFLFGRAMINLTLHAGQLGMGNQFFFDAILKGRAFYPPDIGIADKIAATIFYAWIFFTAAFIFAYAVSYCFSMATIMYFLLRKKVDGIEMTEVFEEKEEGDELAPAGGPGTDDKPCQPCAGKTEGGAAPGGVDTKGEQKPNQPPCCGAK